MRAILKLTYGTLQTYSIGLLTCSGEFDVTHNVQRVMTRVFRFSLESKLYANIHNRITQENMKQGRRHVK